MAVRGARLPPQRLLILFGGITAALAVALVWLAWQLMRQDRTLERQQVRDRLDRAADAVSIALERRFAAEQAFLSEAATSSPESRINALERHAVELGAGALLVDFSSDGPRVAPRAVLLFYPTTAVPDENPHPEFATGERLEFRDRNIEGAISHYKAVANSGNPELLPGALLRLGRVLRKAGRAAEAVSVYDRLAAFDSLAIEGLPAGLLARDARILTLEELGQSDEARAQTESLSVLLSSSHWRLTRGAFEFYDNAATARLARAGGIAPPHAAGNARAVALQLSRAIDTLWHDWIRGAAAAGRTGVSAGSAGGASVVMVDSTPLLVLAHTSQQRRLALIVTPSNLQRLWLADLAPLLSREQVDIALSTSAGAAVTGTRVTDAEARATDAQARVTRAAAETGLPWTLTVAPRSEQTYSADLAARRRIVFSSIAVVVLLVMVGTYAVARAVGRELEVSTLRANFVAAVSHEFRTPLTSMRQIAELLTDGRVRDERKAEYYAALRREGDRLHHLVENLLDFGRMEAGAREFSFERIDVAELVTTTVDDFRREIAPDGYDVTLGAEDTGLVNADREAVSRALRNLLDNAVKYSPERRDIDVAVARVNGAVAISVRDRGVGIPADEQGTIFEQFVRGRQARSAGIRGTGIGLSMVRHIVQAHGGEIRFTSAVGEGSTFTILLQPATES